MITLITGPMFSFKTSRLVHQMEMYSLAKKKIFFIRPKKDDRVCMSHNSGIEETYSNKIKSKITEIFISSFDDLTTQVKEKIKLADVIFVDEYFMITDAYKIAISFYKQNIYYAGLISTSENTLFPEAIKLLPYVDYIDKEDAICMKCGKPANFSKFIGKSKSNDIMVDTNNNQYECLCYDCYQKN